MDLRWGINPFVTPVILHAMDIDKPDPGNPMSICGEVIMRPGEQRCEFGEQRDGKCPKCFKISRKRLQLDKKRRR